MKATLVGIKYPTSPSKKNGKWWYNLSFLFKDRNSDSGSWGQSFIVSKEFVEDCEKDLGSKLKSGEVYNIEKERNFLTDITAAE